ncbi:MAG: rhodanese-like domain-containing protein [Cyclobacteriaceae bacterium]|nr:rhodanese-like domain-containing protein [Cyclobacteriaceae bacterium]
MRQLHSFIYFLLLFSAPACAQQTLEERLESLYHHTVPLVYPAEFSSWQSGQNNLVVLDIRSAEEYQVSHIPGAQLIDYEEFTSQDVTHLAREGKVVVYCSVGYRSERIGEKMQELGFKEVYNLYGGIFEWKNQGHQVIDPQGQPTDSVHTYNKNWSRWLEKGIKVYD